MAPSARIALLGLALVLTAGLFDAEPLWVPGVALLGLGAGAAAWVWRAALGARVERELDALTVVEGEPLTVRVTARSGAARWPGGVIEEPLLERPARLRPASRATRLRIEARFARRGRRELAPARLVLRDPLRLAERVVTAGEPATILVLPRTSPVHAPRGWGAAMAGRTHSPLTVAAEVEIDGLRPYRPGSPASRIHWPALARGHEMVERRLVADLDARPLVVLDAAGPADAEALDAAVRAAASLALELARRGGCSLLLPGERRATPIDPDLHAWPAAHVRLALVVAGGAPRASAIGARSGAVLYVAARPPRSLPRALREAAGGRLLVLPGALPGASPVLEVAGCRGYAAGRALRAAGVA